MYLYAAKDAPPTARLYRALKRLDLPLSAFGYHCTRNTLNCVLPVCLWTGLPLDYILGTRQSARLCRPIRDIETYPKIKFNLLTGVREAIIDCKNNRLIQMFSERRHKMLHCIYSTRPETRRMGSPNINMLGRWIVVFGLRPDALAGIEWEELR